MNHNKVVHYELQLTGQQYITMETVSMKTKGNFIEQWTTLSTLLNKETGNPLGETRSVYKLETYSSST